MKKCPTQNKLQKIATTHKSFAQKAPKRKKNLRKKAPKTIKNAQIAASGSHVIDHRANHCVTSLACALICAKFAIP